DQRQAFNARVFEQVNREVLDLNNQSAPDDINEMEFRQVIVQGEYDHSYEVALRNQVWNDSPGVHLLTPLKIDASDEVILVDRGWIPLEDLTPEEWEKYQEPGLVIVRGVIRASQSGTDFGSRVDPTPMPGEILSAWHLADVERIGAQMPYDLLPVYIQQAPDPEWAEMPYRSEPNLTLSEGPHLGYAVQWFSFALILLVGYPIYVRRESMV
ncbi:MAG: SURF1 family protein, partial [Anaerolineales bacterium]|nr:SURF1 family protein [Anaerolineales bacterium]